MAIGNRSIKTMEIGDRITKSLHFSSHLDERDGPLGAAGAHPAAHGELLPDPGGAFVLPALHFRNPYPPPELPHGISRRRRRRRRVSCGGLRGGAVAAPPGGGGGERRRKEGEASRKRVPGAPDTARRQPEKAAGGSGGRHRQARRCTGVFTAIAAYLLLAF